MITDIIRNGEVDWRDAAVQTQHARARASSFICTCRPLIDGGSGNGVVSCANSGAMKDKHSKAAVLKCMNSLRLCKRLVFRCAGSFPLGAWSFIRVRE